MDEWMEVKGKGRKLHLIRSAENVQVFTFEAVKRINSIISSGGRKSVLVQFNIYKLFCTWTFNRLLESKDVSRQ